MVIRTNPECPTAVPDAPYVTMRLMITLTLMSIGAAGMYIIPVVLPSVQAEFGVRAMLNK